MKEGITHVHAHAYVYAIERGRSTNMYLKHTRTLNEFASNKNKSSEVLWLVLVSSPPKFDMILAREKQSKEGSLSCWKGVSLCYVLLLLLTIRQI